MDWRDFVAFNQRLAMAVVDAPKLVLDLLHATAKDVVLEDFPEFGAIHADIFVRFPRLTYIEPIRNLRRAGPPSPAKTIAAFVSHASRLWGVLWACGQADHLFGRHLQMQHLGKALEVPLSPTAASA